MRQTQRVLLTFFCLCVALTCSKSRKEDLERAAELVVEKAAERAAERAVEKALESGNTTTESKIVRESYSSVRGDSKRKKFEPEEFEDRYASEEESDDEEDGREDEEDDEDLEEIEDWSKVEIRDDDNSWRRFPRRGSRYRDLDWAEESPRRSKKKPQFLEERLGRVQKRKNLYGERTGS